DTLTVRGLGAALLVFAGAALTAGQSSGSVKPAGVALALTTAVVYALYIVLGSRYAADVPSATAAEHVSQACAFVYVPWALLSGQIGVPASLRAWALIGAIGLLC